MANHTVTFDHRPAGDPQARAGDEVTVQGHIIGIRDRTQIRIFDQGVEPPMDLKGAFLLHTAPTCASRRRQVREDLASARRRARAWCVSTEPLGTQYGVRADLRQGRLPPTRRSPDAPARHGLLRDRRWRGGARDDADQEIVDVAWEDPHARMPLEVPRQRLSVR